MQHQYKEKYTLVWLKNLVTNLVWSEKKSVDFEVKIFTSTISTKADTRRRNESIFTYL